MRMTFGEPCEQQHIFRVSAPFEARYHFVRKSLAIRRFGRLCDPLAQLLSDFRDELDVVQHERGSSQRIDILSQRCGAVGSLSTY